MTLSEYYKNKIITQCQPLIEKLKVQYISKNPDKRRNYLVDIYLKWLRNCLYFCEKYKSEHPNRVADEVEYKFVRLKVTQKDRFDFS